MAPNSSSDASTHKLQDTFDPRFLKEVYNLHPHPTTGRLIDSHPGHRTKPMRVLCLGMPRTGTMSLFTALKRLGYNPYHMAVAISSPRTSFGLWTEAIEAKFQEKGKKWGREEFDKILGDYDAVLDAPCMMFVEELAAAYPDAKVILTTRDVEKWLNSINNTVGVINSWQWSLVGPWDPSLAGPFEKFLKIVVPPLFGTRTDFHSAESPARKKFKDHYENVRRTVSKDRMLEYHVQEGWAPLCEFLGTDVPDEPLPRMNDAKEFVDIHAMMWWLAFAKMVGKIGAMVAVPLAGVAIAAWYRRRMS